MKLVLELTVESLSTRVDGSVKVSLASQELDPSQAAALFTLRNKLVKVLFSDSGISPMEEKLIDEEKIVDGRKVKTKSQRLRATLYRVWENEGEPGGDFQKYYDQKMEQLIEHFKSKLNSEAA